MMGLFVAAPAFAGSAARPFAIPIGRAPLALGAGYDSELVEVRSDTGACVVGDGTQRRAASGARYSIATLTRAGGRLVVGIHVSAPLFVESLTDARVTDAARRLERADELGFRDLCGDGYVAALTLGDHFVAELEVERKDVSRARSRLTEGTWAEPAQFRDALEAVIKPHATTARELPGGSRAAARPLTPEELVNRAIRFPATVTAENAKPYLASFEPYSGSAFSGMPLPDPEELDDRTIAAQVFRAGSARSQSAASRAADLRAVQVQRSEPEEEPARREPISIVAEGGPVEVTVVEPAEEGVAEVIAALPAALAPESPPVVAQIRSQAALVFATPGGMPVFATTQAPGGVYAERVRERAYWVPGAAISTPDVQRAIAKARGDAPARGTTVVIVDVGAATVVMTDAAPAGETYSQPAGERLAWIAGVAAPNPSQRAALAAAIQAEARAQ
jgi:hypothetical protein